MWHSNVSNGRVRVVYIDEAHVAGEWPLNSTTASSRTDDPQERLRRAHNLRSDIDWLIDVHSISQMLGAWPELFIITYGTRIVNRVRNVTTALLDSL